MHKKRKIDIINGRVNQHRILPYINGLQNIMERLINVKTETKKYVCFLVLKKQIYSSGQKRKAGDIQEKKKIICNCVVHVIEYMTSFQNPEFVMLKDVKENTADMVFVRNMLVDMRNMDIL